MPWPLVEGKAMVPEFTPPRTRQLGSTTTVILSYRGMEDTSQNRVYEALQTLGGEATTSELRARLREEYPDSKLYEYLTNRLRRLEKGVVAIDDGSTPFEARIVDEEWGGVPDSLANRDFPPGSSSDG